MRNDDTFEIRRPASQSASPPVPASREAHGGSACNTLNLYLQPALMEMHDAYFHHKSAVMMPDTPGGPGTGQTQPSHWEDATIMDCLRNSHPDSYECFAHVPYEPDEETASQRISGLGIIVAVYRFLSLNPDYHLLLAGHTDTTGDVGYNFTLSELRAKNVMHLLQGDRTQWVDICLQKSKVEDCQRILKHVARINTWDCDPGPIDNQLGDRTRDALRRFQQAYNGQFQPAIAVDGVVGRQTWGAIFDLYVDEIAALMNTNAAGLSQYRQVRFVDAQNPYIACGEKKPIDQPERDSYRSETNRRVEFLFFPQSLFPDLSCHSSQGPYCMKGCDRAHCGIYAPGAYRFTYLDPRLLERPLAGGQYRDQFTIQACNDDLSELPDMPDESDTIEMAMSPVDGEDPWAFLEPFAELDPGVGRSGSTDSEGRGGTTIA